MMSIWNDATQKSDFPCFIRSSSADVKQNKRLRVYHPKIKNFSNYRLEIMSILESITLSAGVKIQPKARYFLVKIQHCSNFSLVSLSPHPRSCRGAEPIRQSEERWSRPPKTAIERSDLAEKFQFRESHTEAETNKLLTKSLFSQNKESWWCFTILFGCVPIDEL